MKFRKESALFLLLCSLILVGAYSVLSIPIGPGPFENTTSGRLDETTWSPQSIEAVAGNITGFNIFSWTITRTWQGYYGNITGVIVLSDANNNTLYDWEDLNPTGKIYAARTATVDWPNIACAAQSELDTDEAQFSGTNETNRYGKYPVDAPNRTFVVSAIGGVNAQPANFSDYPSLYVGSVQIDPSTCPSTSLHNEQGSYVDFTRGDQNSGNDPEHFRQLVLADGSGTGNIVYTSLIEDDYLGFDNRTHDFEMIVAEDGHGTDTSTTTYYFYVELE